VKKIYSSIAVKKGLITLFLLFIYVVGSRITLPFVDLNSRDFLGGSTAYLAFSGRESEKSVSIFYRIIAMDVVDVFMAVAFFF